VKMVQSYITQSVSGDVARTGLLSTFFCFSCVLGRDYLLPNKRSPCSRLLSLGLICPVLPRTPNVQVILPPFLLPCTLACYELRLEVLDDLYLMTSYYIDPERCFEVPFRIPLPDKEKMATRLANIRLITKNARERQSLSNTEHRRRLSTQLTKYRDKAKAIMECGRLKGFVGNLAERYLDYLDFHQESLDKLSPLIIPVPPLCSPLGAPSPCLLCVFIF
jgi:hypothetical protein